MKRMHVHVAVENLQDNIRFYSSLFGTAPSVVKEDYAKWMLDDPRVNFAISMHGDTPGVNHLGMQVENQDELADVRARLTRAEVALVEQQEAECCYAKSNKYWVTDPQGVAWETFETLNSIPVFSNTPHINDVSPLASKAACCMPG